MSNNRGVAVIGLASGIGRVCMSERAARSGEVTYMGYLGMLYQKNRSQIRGFLLSGRLASEGLLDSRAIEDFIAAALPPRDQAFLRMFELCMVENWVRHQP